MSDELFDSLSSEWWNENGPFKALHSFNLVRIKYIKKYLGKKSLKNLKVLDIGCGGGILCEPLARLGAIVTGIDSNKKAICVAKEHARKQNLRITYLDTDLEKIKNGTYDLITCMEVLEHVTDINKIISKSGDLLKKNGFFFGSTINKTFISYFFAIFIAENILRIIPKGTHEWNKLIKPNYLKKKFLQNGFSSFQSENVLYNPLNNSWKNSNFSKINYLFCAINQ